MDNDKIVKFRMLRNIFNLSFMMEMKTYLKLLDEENLTVQDHIDYVYAESKAMLEEGAKKNHTFLGVSDRCKICNHPMTLHPVNISPETQTGDDSKYVWQCRNASCMEQVFIKEI